MLNKYKSTFFINAVVLDMIKCKPWDKGSYEKKKKTSTK